MNLDALLHREPVVPFAPGSRIPWNEPGFSQRMLAEHLSQLHDRASRRFEIIDRQVAWLHHAVLEGRTGRVLDLGCGPGLYTSRLAQRGHRCIGLDFSPASIAYAKAQASAAGDACEYALADLREADLGSGFDAIMMWFGEFNTFAPNEADALATRIQAALAPGGKVILELHAASYVEALGEEPPHWSVHESGLFSDGPHLALRESCWHPEHSATTERYFVFRENSAADIYAQSTQAYSETELDAKFRQAGLVVAGRYESLTGNEEDDADLYGLVLAGDGAA